VTPELAPVTCYGGIGEGLGALARALARRGDHVTVALPRWRDSGAAFAGSSRALRLRPGEDVSVLEGELAPRLRVAIVDAPSLAGRPHVYGDDVEDLTNASRFALFARAVIELVRERALTDRPFAILHAHEWPCAVIPYLLRESRARSPELATTRSMLTLHNLAFQGVFPGAVLAALGLGDEHASPERLGTRVPTGQTYVSFLQGGILAADALTTVSPTYAGEILRSPFGQGLEAALATRKASLTGLLNGIDQDAWDPQACPSLPAHFSRNDLGGKAACKEALLAELGIGGARDRPLVVSVGRVVRQKGSDLLAASMQTLVDDVGVTVVVAGAGEADLEARLREAASSRPEHARYLGRVPDPLVHRLIAAADLVAMPSRFEPCGIVQMYAHRYGAVPVARRTGGLADTIAAVSPSLHEGTGFLFDPPTEAALVGALRDAVSAMAKPAWRGLQARIMEIDHGWLRRSSAYAALYKRVAAEAR